MVADFVQNIFIGLAAPPQTKAYSLGDQFQEVFFAPAGCQPFVFDTQFEGFLPFK